MCDLEADVKQLAITMSARLVDGIDQDTTTGEQATEELVAIKALVDRLQARTTELARVVQRTGVWREDGSRSDVAWLSRLLKVDHGTAFDEMKIARVLDTELPVLASAYRAGEVSWGHVVAVIKTGRTSPTRMEKLPEFDESLTNLAKLVTPGQMRQHMKGWADAADPLPAIKDDLAAWENRFFRMTQFGSGWNCEGYLTNDVGLQLKATLNAIAVKNRRARTPQQQSDLDEHDSHRSEFLNSINSRDLADALGDLAILAATCTDLPTSGGVGPVIAITVPLERIQDMNAHGSAIASVSNGPGETVLGHQTLQRMMCDASIYRIVFGPEGEVLDVGRQIRTISRAQRRALNFRDKGCVTDGCNAPPQWCDGHHLVEWEHGGETDLENLALLCKYHHTQLHANTFNITRTPNGKPTIHINMLKKDQSPVA